MRTHRSEFSGLWCFRLLLGFVLLVKLAGAATAQDVSKDVADALARADAAVGRIVAVPKGERTFANTIGALDDLSVRLDNETSLILFMQYVSADAKEREASRAAEEAVSNWTIELGKREDLYEAVKAYADTKPSLEGEQRRLLEFTMRDYRRAGMDLPKPERERLAEVEKELVRLATQYQTNIYEDETAVLLTAEELQGVPKEVLARLPQGAGLYFVGMDGPTLNAVLEHAENELTRQKYWYAYKRRGGQRNVVLLEQILRLRAEAAKLLGYDSPAHYETETRMAKNPDTVAKFYEELKPIVRKKAQLDFQEFQEAKRSLTGDPEARLQPWDYGFIKNALQRDKYAVDSRKVAEYFPLERVYDGLFQITERLYGIEFVDVTDRAEELGLPIWHEDVQLFEVYDREPRALLGRVYVDMHPRDNKYNHAACWGLRARKEWEDGSLQVPLTALVCNFTKPTDDKPSLLTHDEVETFFHEFGHALHHLFSETRYGRFSGTAVARDFVEAPSQMFENWVWSPEVLNLFARHYETGEPLPAELLEGMERARTLGSGMEAERQFYYGLVDQRYHTAIDGEIDTTQVGVDMLAEVEMYEPPIGSYFQAAFGHLMGYQAAYYGYMWSLVYAQDMFERFDELGILDPEAGMYYRKRVLARGGSMDEMDLLRDYLGREPRMEAFLRHLGLEPTSTVGAGGRRAPG
jgi:thimet oligopeptidase